MTPADRAMIGEALVALCREMAAQRLQREPIAVNEFGIRRRGKLIDQWRSLVERLEAWRKEA